MGELHKVAIQRKTIRAGIGKMRGRKYKKNAGLLFVIGEREEEKIKGIDIVKAGELIVSDLAENGARLTLFSEKAVEELNAQGKNIRLVIEDNKNNPKEALSGY